MSRKLAVLKSVFGAIRNMTTSSNGGYNNILTDKYGGIMTIAINRPEKRNAVNPETAKELFQAFTDFEEDKEALVAVLHGKGGNFCAGYDLTALAGAGADESVFQEQLSSGQAPMGPSRMCFSKPVIACIDGYAVAGGLELALLCDLRVVEESAVLGVFCRRFGVPLLDGGTVRLQKLIGLSRAMDLILTGRSVSGQEAADIGLANKITATGSGLAESIQLAHTLLKFPQKCMNTDRQSAYYAAYSATSQQDALRYEYENGVKVLVEESIPGAQKFTKGIGKHGSFNLNKPSKPKL
ncbi:short-chain-enoyl-CoA hydratase-like [Mercenaria mercenaria]|uniref:short-chain-enoyl-CoA hydratase-like n=1 Tax=Mercenaria mercenaria TaxID=6596 RepID=UPI00234F794A|nr:short-chain-enoyl-CoA hydratase-like [Mercenaria mercenaria]